MNGHNLNSIVASLVYAYVYDLIELPVQLLFCAEDRGLNLAYNTCLLIKYDRFDFSSIEHGDAKCEHGKGYEVLPPVTFSVSFEENTVVAKSQMVDQIEGDQNHGSPC